jgi:signal recognition particle receptor subunit beta
MADKTVMDMFADMAKQINLPKIDYETFLDIHRKNIEAMQNLYDNMLEYGYDLTGMPFVMQYNKRDLPPAEISPIEELDETLNFRDVPYFPGVAVNGGGVFETLRSVASLVLSRLSAPAVGES